MYSILSIFEVQEVEKNQVKINEVWKVGDVKSRIDSVKVMKAKGSKSKF